MGFDLLGKIIDLRDHLIHVLNLGYNRHCRFVGGNINQLSIDTQAVADLRNASPDHEVCIEFFPKAVNIGHGKLFTTRLLQGGQ